MLVFVKDIICVLKYAPSQVFVQPLMFEEELSPLNFFGTSYRVLELLHTQYKDCATVCAIMLTSEQSRQLF